MILCTKQFLIIGIYLIGAGGGIGRTICQRFAREGASVIAADIDGASAIETVATLADLGGNDVHHSHFELDVSSSDQVGQFMAQVKKNYEKHPCISINCHGITRDDFLIKMTEESFNEVINVNLKVFFLML
jgi:NAD(P)-dependent dehydrogenase (short-subunit alcohol dehydrogenase family)